MKIFTFFLMLFFASMTINAQTYFSNNFDGTPIAEGWTSFTNGIGPNQSWTVYAIGNSAPNAAGVKYENVTSGLAEDYFATPLIDLTSATSPRLSFMASQGYDVDYGSTYHVLVSTTSQNEIDAYTEIASWDESTLPTTWDLILVDLADYAGQQIYIAFMMSNDDGDYFFIDDVTVEEALENNATLLDAPVMRYLTANQEVNLDFIIRNSGSNPITSLELNWYDNTDNTATITDLNIASGQTITITHPTPISYSTVGQQNITATVTQVNNTADSFPADNVVSTATNVISQSGNKKILFEEGTGTWCGWCPRGMVAMEYMQENYADKFIGVAVHNGDPMMNAEYDNGSDFSGFPSMNVDRKLLGTDVSIPSMEEHITAFDVATPVDVNGIASVEAIGGREVIMNVSSTFYSNFSNADFRLGVIIVEDGVTGASSGYAQENYYSGGASGDMGGFENLPNPVPASDMVYDHVGRDLIGGFNGQEGSVPSEITDGQVVTYSFNYTVPDSYDINHLHGVVVLIDQNTGEVVNSNIFPIGNLGVNDVVDASKGFAVYPNPATNQVNLSLKEAGKYNVTVYNVAGQSVLTQNVEVASNRDNVSLSLNNLKPGVYIITAATNGKSFSKKLIIK